MPQKPSPAPSPSLSSAEPDHPGGHGLHPAGHGVRLSVRAGRRRRLAGGALQHRGLRRRGPVHDGADARRGPARGRHRAGHRGRQPAPCVLRPVPAGPPARAAWPALDPGLLPDRRDLFRADRPAPQHPGPPAGGGGAAQPGLVDAGHGPGRPAGHAAAPEPARPGLRAGRPVRRADGGAMAAAPQRRPAVDRAGGLRSGPGRGAGPCPGHRHRPEPGGGPGVAQPPPPRQLPEHQA
jgi:hypothetical protein